VEIANPCRDGIVVREVESRDETETEIIAT
jgi:hypothetical protein